MPSTSSASQSEADACITAVAWSDEELGVSRNRIRALPRIFISHASANDIEAKAFKLHLVDCGIAPDDVFVDHDDGVQAHTKWKDALAVANAAAGALICLVSPEWLASRWSQIEVGVAEQLRRMDRHQRRAIIIAMLPGTTRAEMQAKGFTEDQITDLAEPGAVTVIRKVAVKDASRDVTFSSRSLEKIRHSLDSLGILAETFDWEPRNPKRPSPFPGLEAFSEKEAGVFFGRERRLTEALSEIEDKLAQSPARIMSIVAASGVGKSSFLRAGLWPRLKRRSSYLPLPILKQGSRGIVSDQEGGLIHTMAGWFSEKEQSVDSGWVRSQLGTPISRDGLGKVLAEAIQLAPPGAAPRLLLGLDQAEELFDTTDRDKIAEREQFLAALFGLLSNPARGIDLLVVATIRADSLGPMCEAIAAARGVAEREIVPNVAGLGHWSFPLEPMSTTDYRSVIEKPVEVAYRKAGTLGRKAPQSFEAALVEHLVKTFTGKDALPLLAIALDQLYTEHIAQNVITLDHYKSLYGDEGASGPIRHALENAYKNAGEVGTPEHLRRLIIPELATWDDEAGAAKRIPTQTAVLLSGERARLEPLVEAMVEARLLVRDRETIEVAHEALLRQEPLGGWLEENKGALRQRRDVLREANEWKAAQTSPDGPLPPWDEAAKQAEQLARSRARRASGDTASEFLVRRGDRLVSAIRLAGDPDYRSLREVAGPYLQACLAAESAQDERQRRIIGTAFVKPALQALEEGLSDHALRLAVAGAVLADDLDLRLVPELSGPVGKAIHSTRIRSILCGHRGSVAIAAFSPDGRRIVTASDDNTARVWDVERGSEIATLKGHEGPVQSAAFSPDGRRIVTASYDNTARVWDVERGSEIATL
ncbi:MAG: TIR domain-containing protein, partial [Hyphomicrobiales bacterium]